MLHSGEQERCQPGREAFGTWAHPAVGGTAVSPELKLVVREPLRGCRVSK